MPSTIIVTASDARFFHLLAGLLQSLEAQGGSREIAIGLFDLGLTAAQRDWVAPRITQSVEPGWDLDVPDDWRSERPHLRSLTVRPFLPRHFPGYDTYIWIDADVWLQDWRGIELYTLGSRNSDVTVTPHTDRAYPFDRSVLRHRYRQFRQGFGRKVAYDLSQQQHLNAGVFAARAGSALWDHWASAYQEAIDTSGGVMVSDQIALNFAVFEQRLTVHLLSALYNWQCHLAFPIWDQRTQQFCEPHLPHTPISLLHLTHKSKDGVHEIRGLDGKPREMKLQNPAVATLDLPIAEPADEA